MTFLEWLQALPEDHLYRIIEDLLGAMKFKRIECVHGPGEVGKDIVFCEETPIHRHIWRAVQVKTKLSGNASAPNYSLKAIVQCEAAVRNVYQTTHGAVAVNEVWLITPHLLSAEAKRPIEYVLNERTSKTILIEGAELADLLNEHLPGLVEQSIGSPNSYALNLLGFCDAPDDFIATAFRTKFALNEVFVEPDFSIDLVAPDSVQNLPRFTEAINWAPLQDLHLKLALLDNGILSLSDLVELRSTLNKLQKCGELMQAGAWDDTVSSEAFQNCLDRIVKPIEAMVRRPTVLQEDHMALKSLTLEPRAANTKVKASHRRYTEEVTRALSSWPRHPSQRTPSVSLTELSDARDVLVKALKASLDPPTHLGLTGANENLLRLSPSSNPLISTKGADPNMYSDFEHFTQTLCEHLDRFSDHVERLRQTYIDTFRTIEHRLSSPLALNDFSNSDLDGMVACNELTFLFAEIAGTTDVITQYRVDGLSVLRRLPRVALHAEVGMGKTTLAKKWCFLMATEYRNGYESLPLHIALAKLKLADGDDDDRSHGNVRRLLLSSATKAFSTLSKYVEDGVLWVLDGFDEIGDTESAVQIVNWCVAEGRDGGKVVITSRPHSLPLLLAGFARVAILPLSPQKRDKLIRSLPWSNPEEADLLITALRDDADLARLSGTPLMLTLLIVLSQYDGAKNIPKRRDKIYRRIVALMLFEWDRRKALQRDYAIPDEETRFVSLRKIAFYYHRRKERVFSADSVIEALANSVPGVSYRSAEQFFQELLRDCVISPQGQGKFSFFHLSIQEYLAGEEIAEDMSLTKREAALNEYFRGESWWEESLVFLAAIKRDVSILVNRLHVHVPWKDTETEKRKIRRLLERWFQVADLTPIAELNPHGPIAAVLAEMDFGGLRARWLKNAHEFGKS